MQGTKRQVVVLLIEQLGGTSEIVLAAVVGHSARSPPNVKPTKSFRASRQERLGGTFAVAHGTYRALG